MFSLGQFRKLGRWSVVKLPSLVARTYFPMNVRQTIILICVIFALPSFVSALDLSTKSEIEKLQRRLESLEGEIDKKEEALTVGTVSKYIRFSGLVEVEAFYTKTGSAQAASDIVLSTVQLATEINFGENIGGNIVFLHEEGETEPVVIDEAFISFSRPFASGSKTSLIAGRFYLPFGNFHSAMLTEPLTLELAETSNSAVQVNYDMKWFEIYAAIFNGETDTIGSRDNIDTFVAALQLKPFEKISLGAYFMSDLAESDIGLVADPVNYGGSVSGAGGYLSMEAGKFSINLEYISALESFDAVTFGEDLTGPEPKAWNAELCFIPIDRLGMAVRYEKADDFKGDLSRYGGVVYYTFFGNTVLALEYMKENLENGGSDTHVVTTQLALGF